MPPSSQANSALFIAPPTASANSSGQLSETHASGESSSFATSLRNSLRAKDPSAEPEDTEGKESNELARKRRKQATADKDSKNDPEPGLTNPSPGQADEPRQTRATTDRAGLPRQSGLTDSGNPDRLIGSDDESANSAGETLDDTSDLPVRVTALDGTVMGATASTENTGAASTGKPGVDALPGSQTSVAGSNSRPAGLADATTQKAGDTLSKSTTEASTSAATGVIASDAGSARRADSKTRLADQANGTINNAANAAHNTSRSAAGSPKTNTTNTGKQTDRSRQSNAPLHSASQRSGKQNTTRTSTEDLTPVTASTDKSPLRTELVGQSGDSSLLSAAELTTGDAVAQTDSLAINDTLTGIDEPADAAELAEIETVLDPASVSEEFQGELADRLVSAIRHDMDHAEIRISPRELGPILVDLKIDGDTANVTFSADNSATRQALQDSLQSLRDMLAREGWQLGQADVRDDPGSRQMADQRRDEGNQRHNAPSRGESARIDDLASASGYRAPGQTQGLVDLFA